MWRNGARAALTITFDDGYLETHRSTVNFLASQGLQATYFIPTAAVGGCLEGMAVASWDDWRLAAENGMEIASHSVRHRGVKARPRDNFNRLLRSFRHDKQRWEYLRSALVNVLFPQSLGQGTISSDEIPEELRCSRMAISAEVPVGKVVSYSYPFGAYDVAYRQALESAGYSSARSLDRGLNQPGKTDLFALKSIVWNRNMTIDVANSWVDSALADGSWLIEVFHLVADHPPAHDYADYTSTDAFRRHLEYVQRANIWIGCQREIVEHLQGIPDREESSQ